MTQVYEVTVSDTRKIEFRQNGKLHRLDGPAVQFVGGCSYWENGELHRLDGPALIQGIIIRYYIKGVHYTSKEAYDFAIQPTKELTIQEIEDLLGYKIKVIK